MSNYETVCDRLDDLALRNLHLSNDLIRLKLDLDSRLRDGWLSMAKTRFGSGFHRFGIVNLPDYDLMDASNDDVCPQIVVDLTSTATSDKKKDSDNMKSEISPTKFTTRIDADGEPDQKKAKEEMERRLLKRFGGMAPPSLRQGQRTFETLLELVCEIATMESELLAVVDEYKKLTSLKDKFGTER